MIQMTNGFTYSNGKIIDEKTGPVQLSTEAEDRLVACGVAKRIGTASVAGVNSGSSGSVNPCEDCTGNPSVTTAEDKNGAEATQEAPEYSMQNTLKELIAICEANDIDIPAKATKRVLIELLDNAFDGSSPDLTAVMPV